MFGFAPSLMGAVIATPSEIDIDFSVPRGPLLTYYLATLGVSFSTGLNGYGTSAGSIPSSPDGPGFASNWDIGNTPCTISLPGSPVVTTVSFIKALSSTGMKVTLIAADGVSEDEEFTIVGGGGGYSWSARATLTRGDNLPINAVTFKSNTSTGRYAIDSLILS